MGGGGGGGGGECQRIKVLRSRVYPLGQLSTINLLKYIRQHREITGGLHITLHLAGDANSIIHCILFKSHFWLRHAFWSSILFFRFAAASCADRSKSF